MLGVDRLDMIKGIPQKILAFEKFLEENPVWRDKVVLLQIAVPTRTDVPECRFLSVLLIFTGTFMTLLIFSSAMTFTIINLQNMFFYHLLDFLFRSEAHMPSS